MPAWTFQRKLRQLLLARQPNPFRDLFGALKRRQLSPNYGRAEPLAADDHALR
jgi:hypothetical protein